MYIQNNMDTMSGLNFFKKLQNLIQKGNIRKDGEQMGRHLKDGNTSGRGGYTLGRGRGKGVKNCENPGQTSPFVVVSGRMGRGRGVRNGPCMDKVGYTTDHTLDEGETVKKDHCGNSVSLEISKNGDINSENETKLSKKERKRRRKLIQNKQRLEECEIKDANSKNDVQSEDKNLVDKEDDLLDKLVNSFRSNLVVSKKAVDTKYFVNDLEEIAGGVIKRAAIEFEKKLNEIRVLKTEKETLETNYAGLKTELVDDRNKAENIFADKSKEMMAVLVNLRSFERENNENGKEMVKIDEQLKILLLKAKILSEKQNKIDSKIKECVSEKRSIQTFLSTENKKANDNEADINNKLDALAINMKEIDDKITNVKNCQTLEEITPPKPNSNSMMIQFLENTIETKSKQLECPVCFNIAAAPIFSCSESHLVCGSCRPKLRLCPECRLPYKEQMRHRYAEIMAKELDTLRQQKNKLETSNIV